MNNILADCDVYGEPRVKTGKKYPPVLKVIRNAIPKEVMKILDIEFTVMRDCLETLGMDVGYGDATVPNSFSWYSPICFESLSLYLKPLIEKEVQAEIYPTYSYARIYLNNSRLPRHTDLRKSSQIAVSCCLRKDEGIYWPICFETESGIVECDTNPGDIVIFPGTVYEHWRDEYPGKENMQAFLLYVYADGEYSHLKYDTRPCLASGYEMTEEYRKKCELNNRNG